MPNGLVSVKFIQNKFNSDKYIELLKTFAIPIMNLNYKSYWFVQDNASIHASKKVVQYLSGEITTLAWPSKSPDLNIMENVWKMLSDLVYNECQPRNNAELKERILRAVETLNRDQRQTVIGLYQSFRCRLTKLLLLNGSIINKKDNM